MWWGIKNERGAVVGSPFVGVGQISDVDLPHYLSTIILLTHPPHTSPVHDPLSLSCSSVERHPFPIMHPNLVHRHPCSSITSCPSITQFPLSSLSTPLNPDIRTTNHPSPKASVHTSTIHAQPQQSLSSTSTLITRSFTSSVPVTSMPSLSPIRYPIASHSSSLCSLSSHPLSQLLQKPCQTFSSFHLTITSSPDPCASKRPTSLPLISPIGSRSGELFLHAAVRVMYDYLARAGGPDDRPRRHHCLLDIRVRRPRALGLFSDQLPSLRPRHYMKYSSFHHPHSPIHNHINECQ